MVGKARTFSDAAREAVYQKEFDDELYSAAAQQNSYNLGSVHFSDNSGIANITQAGTDQRKANLKGALFTGNIGFNLQTAVLDVSTDTIDLLNDASGNALSVVSTDRFVTLSTGSTADLVTILGAQRPGHRLRLYNTLTNTITVKHTAAATINTIRTPTGTDLTFPGNAILDLTFDITSAQWRVVSNLGGGGTGISFPIIPPVDVRGNVSTTQNIDLSQSTAHSTTMTLTGNISITFSNFPVTANQIEWEIQITQDGTGGRAVSWPAAVTPIPVLDTDPNAVSIVVLRTNDGGTVIRTLLAPEVSSGGGEIFTWTADHDANGFALVDGRIADATDATKIVDFDLSSMTTGITGVLDFNFTTAKTITFSDAVGTVVLSPMAIDLNANTFDIFDIDSLIFMPTAGTLGSLNVGFSSLGSGSFRANILNDGQFEWTEENVSLMQLSEASSVTTLDVVGILAAEINLSETTGGDVGSIQQGTATLQYVTPVKHEFAVGVESILQITSDGIVMQGDNFITTPQIGFSILGNIIEDDSGGMIFSTPVGDDYRFTDGTTDFAALDIDGLFLNDLYVQYQHILTPTVPGLITQGQIFFNSATNRLNFQRRNDGDTAWITIDLEGLGTGANQQLSNLSGTVAVNLDLDPATTNARDIGNFSLRWQQLFVQAINVSSGAGLGVTADLVPSTTGALLLGNTSRRWLTLNTDRIRLTTSTNTIFESGGNMRIESPNDIEFRIGGAAAGRVVSSSEWDFQGAILGDVNAINFADGAILTSLPTDIELNLPAGEEFILQDNAVDFASFGEAVTTLTRTDTGAVGVALQLALDSSSPANEDVLATIEARGRTSTAVMQNFAEIDFTAITVENGDEDGMIELKVSSNGSDGVTGFEVRGGVSSVAPQLGFFGQGIRTSIPTITGSRGGNAALASLLTALDAFGLIIDGTT